MTTDAEYYSKFNFLYDDVKKEEALFSKKPLLAHYTSIPIMEQIFKNNEIWMSNPLFMNDHEEVKFVVIQSEQFVRESTDIDQALQSDVRRSNFQHHFNQYFLKFANDQILDTYIFCLSEHDPKDFDGVLSMWRAYGSSGNGAAIVFDSNSFEAREGSPLMISKIHYGTKEDRMDWVKNLILKFSKVLNEIPDDKLFLAAFALFERIKIFSLFTKHKGFEEENEWRIVYNIGRDNLGLLEGMLSYDIRSDNVQPKLKLKVTEIPWLKTQPVSLEPYVDRVILGPSQSELIVQATVQRMFKLLKIEKMMPKVYASKIPLRNNK
ncbi:MAG: DUF2971 domain-containing protein [Alphaproteobacteria bacterium]